jgi:aspartate racemase
MKTIGIIGGLGPEATIDYYKEMIQQVNLTDKTLNYPEIVIFSVTMRKFIEKLKSGDKVGAAEYIMECVLKLEAAGVDFAAISANTPHLFFDEIQEKVNVPLISIVEVSRIKAKQMGLKRCGLFGTKFTMDASFFSDVFAKDNIEVISPDEDDVERINELLFTELELGIFKESTKKELLQIVQKMIDKRQIDSLILGCTEFPIMFTQEEYLGIPFLNTTRIHVEAILEKGMI